MIWPLLIILAVLLVALAVVVVVELRLNGTDFSSWGDED